MLRCSDEQIINAAKEYSSMRSAALSLGMDPTHFRRRAKKLGVYSPNQGGKGISRPERTQAFGNELIPLEEILRGEHPQYPTLKLKRRLYKNGIKTKRCELCQIVDWKGETLEFHLHHRNGIHNDHRLENLQILCPNCHSQTDSYAGKNSGRVA